MSQPKFPFKTPFGQFSNDGKSFVITRPDTPRPWTNIISSGSYGTAVSQTGAGYSWLHHGVMNRVTHWGQDLVQDNAGRFIYIQDEKTGEFWSVGWQPVRAKMTQYECVHGMGYTMITSLSHGIQSQWLVFVPHDEPLEIWRLRLRDVSKKPRRLKIWTYIEWNSDESLNWQRHSYGRSSFETSWHDDNKIILARKRIFSAKNGHFSDQLGDWTAWHSVNVPVKEACNSKESFIGRYGSLQAPSALIQKKYTGEENHVRDGSIASFCVPVSLNAEGERSLLMTVGASLSREEALVKSRKFRDFSQVDTAWHLTELFWDRYLSAFRVETPDSSFNLLTNSWLKYQVLSSCFWGRTAYYRIEGTGMQHDLLQDSHVFLSIDPDKVRKQIIFYAAQQFPDGPFACLGHSFSGKKSSLSCTEALLWLPYMIVQYLRETGDWNVLNEKIIFRGKKQRDKHSEVGSLYDHACRALQMSLKLTGPHGLPLSGEFNCADKDYELTCENTWMAHFLYGVLVDWAEMIKKAVEKGHQSQKELNTARRYRQAAAKLKKSLNKYAWDGEWFLAGIMGQGTVWGSKKQKEGGLDINSQTWALLNHTADSVEKENILIKTLDKYLYRQRSKTSLVSQARVPGHECLRPHAAYCNLSDNEKIDFRDLVWVLIMECGLGRAGKAWELYKSISPVLRGSAGPEQYQCEPYVTPGVVQGAGARLSGCGEYSWYNGSASWLLRACVEGFMGIQPVWEGLRIRPCLPPEWQKAKCTRVFRDAHYHIVIERDNRLPAGSQKITFNNEQLAGNIIPMASSHTKNEVKVMIGPSRQ